MRLLAFGSRALMDGFALLGIETFADASASEVGRILTSLSRGKEKALVFLQQDLAREDIPILQELRSEGGSILISEVPDILSADQYEAQVDQLIKRVLGSNIEIEAGHG